MMTVYDGNIERGGTVGAATALSQILRKDGISVGMVVRYASLCRSSIGQRVQTYLVTQWNDL